MVFVPLLVGNVVIWKPSPMATYVSSLILSIFLEAGLPPNVIQFLPCPNGQPTISLIDKLFEHKYFAGLHFTGSTAVFKQLWRLAGERLDTYLSYPRLVGETGGKNWQLVQKSADREASAIQAIRGAFEYQGVFSHFAGSPFGVLNTFCESQVRNARLSLDCMFPSHSGQTDSRTSFWRKPPRSQLEVSQSLNTSLVLSCTFCSFLFYRAKKLFGSSSSQ